jgi:3-phosphoshikimate 1-carboxyvinyltransferase
MPSRDHTERMLKSLGVPIETSDSQISISPITQFAIRGTSRMAVPPRDNSQFAIPADFSSAAFFIVAALLVPNSEVCLEGVGLNPTRTGLLDALTRMGARFKIENAREVNNEPEGDLIVRAANGLKATDVSGSEIPRLIDEFPIFAIAATQARAETRVRDAAELRVKESDRIATLTSELRKLGAQIEPHADGFTIAGPTPLRGARVNSHGDHRLAMSLAVAGLIAEGETIIENWECVGDSFPNFGTLVSQVAGRKIVD